MIFYIKILSKLQNINGVAFTGSLATAKKIQNNLNEYHKEILPLIAETGGINAMIVDSSALLEQATDDIVRSAFDSAGQRCSALRVLCIQDDIYHDLLKMIKGNMQELKISNPLIVTDPQFREVAQFKGIIDSLNNSNKNYSIFYCSGSTCLSRILEMHLALRSFLRSFLCNV